MRIRSLVASLAALLLGAAVPVAAQTTLNVVTAGDQNMVDYVNDFLGPRFEKMNPGVKVRAVGTGPGVRLGADRGGARRYALSFWIRSSRSDSSGNCPVSFFE